MNQQGVHGEHHKDGEVFIEVLHGDRAAGAHEHVATVLQQCVHRNHEEAGENADGDHDAAGTDHSVADFKAEDFNDAGNEILIVEACAAHDEPHGHAHRKNNERLFKRYEGCCTYGTESNTDRHHSLKNGAVGKMHAERLFGPL